MSACPSGIDELPGRLMVECEVAGQLGGRLLEQFQVARVGHHAHEGPDRPLRRLVGGNSGIVKDLAPSLHIRRPEPDGEDRKAPLAEQTHQGLGHGRGIAQGLRAHHDQKRVDLRGVHTDFHRSVIPLGRGVSEDIDRVPMAPKRRQDLIQTRQSRIAQGRRVHPKAR